MPTVHKTPAFAATTEAAELTAEFLLVPTFEQDDFSDVPWLTARAHGQIERARARGELSGKLYEVFLAVLDGDRPVRAALVGAGPRESFTADRLRRVATTSGLTARRGRYTTVNFVHRATSLDVATAAQVIADRRMRLALIILSLANIGGRDLDEIKNEALAIARIQEQQIRSMN